MYCNTISAITATGWVKSSKPPAASMILAVFRCVDLHVSGGALRCARVSSARA